MVLWWKAWRGGSTPSFGQLAVLINLNGTLHIGDKPTPGSVDALQRLRKVEMVRVKFFTNATTESRQQIQKRLKSIGFKIETDEIFTPLIAARRLVEKRALRPLLLVEEEAVEDFQGLPYVLPGNLNSINPWWKRASGQLPPTAVIVGSSQSHFNYQSINEAFQCVMKNNADIFAVSKYCHFKNDDGTLVLGPGSLIEAIEFATNRKAILVGKPEKSFFQGMIETVNSELKGEFELEPDDFMVVGDNVRDDVAGAEAADIRSVLVQTGDYRNKDEDKKPVPWLVVENFAQAVDRIQQIQNNDKCTDSD